MKKFLVALFAFYLLSTTTAQALTTEQTLACEAIMCLSTEERPVECGASVAHYFSIQRGFPTKTTRARKAFLNQCPTASETGMPTIVSSILANAKKL
ncbi:TrbM/KikA/MpfK family conjugal transfer protein [Desulfotalea psychrophila]|uniref:Related to TrbM protein (Partial length) n=1 Tax=Desulfotalea psychrophila (strain LSv54 / DSM 12343) TaxID=177439 RepID=Q6AIF7_DESPS|nr:TrbM/KikA/MpfK family conjugal transfer protein [Desulfotalea psychrophila]CAG37890.1 related to TrbM protein (partial length) [Desulfotalea psychrophila LSv54]